MTPSAFRRVALSLPETHEAPHFVRASFRVGKKIFATLAPEGDEAMVRVVPHEKVRSLLETYPDVFFSYGGWTERNGSLGVRLAKADPGLMKDLLHDAWWSVAPKKVQALSPAAGPPPSRAARRSR